MDSDVQDLRRLRGLRKFNINFTDWYDWNLDPRRMGLVEENDFHDAMWQVLGEIENSIRANVM